MVGLNYSLSKVINLAEEWKCKTFLVTDDELINDDDDFDENNDEGMGSPRSKLLPLMGILTNRDCIQ